MQDDSIRRSVAPGRRPEARLKERFHRCLTPLSEVERWVQTTPLRGTFLDVGGITVSVCLCAPQPSGFLFFRVCVFHNVAHSSAWCAPLSTERQPPRHAIANYTFATGSHNHGITARSSVECSSMVRTSTVNGYMFGSVRVG